MLYHSTQQCCQFMSYNLRLGLLLDRILLSSVPRATVRTFKPKKSLKKLKNKNFVKKPWFYQPWETVGANKSQAGGKMLIC